MALLARSGPRPLIQFRNHFSQTVGPLGRVISPSLGRHLNTGQHRHRINTYTPNIHALIETRTHDPSVRASEDSSCLKPRGYYNWHSFKWKIYIWKKCLLVAEISLRGSQESRTVGGNLNMENWVLANRYKLWQFYVCLEILLVIRLQISEAPVNPT
jgi:hypothetical protein